MSEPVKASEHRTPEGVSEQTIEGVGKLSEGFEYIERAKGHLYSFHQLSGSADLALQEGVATLREAGHHELAEEIDAGLVGRNVLPDRWTFQIVEEFDRLYHDAVVAAEATVREELVAGRRHVFESELKERRRTQGRKDHEARPVTGDGDG